MPHGFNCGDEICQETGIFATVMKKTQSLAKLQILKKKKNNAIHIYIVEKQNFTDPFPKHLICTAHFLARSQQIFMCCDSFMFINSK